jgi:ankyrin repeat protein
MACGYGHLETAKILLNAGREERLQTNNRGAACQEDQVMIAKTLIEAGGAALLFKTCMNGSTCLHAACNNGHLKVVKALMEAGGEELLFETRENGSSCLFTASERES